jgi:hypothetical protein
MNATKTKPPARHDDALLAQTLCSPSSAAKYSAPVFLPDPSIPAPVGKVGARFQGKGYSEVVMIDDPAPPVPPKPAPRRCPCPTWPRVTRRRSRPWPWPG